MKVFIVVLIVILVLAYFNERRLARRKNHVHSRDCQAVGIVTYRLEGRTHEMVIAAWICPLGADTKESIRAHVLNMYPNLDVIHVDLRRR